MFKRKRPRNDELNEDQTNEDQTNEDQKSKLPQSYDINKVSSAKFFYIHDPPDTIKQLDVVIEPLNKDGITDKATYGLQPGETFHNTKVRNGRLQTFGTDLTLKKELMEKIKRMIQRKRQRVFEQDDAENEGKAHHNSELRQQNLDKFLEIFYYPVKLLMKYIESKNFSTSLQSSIKIKDISDLKISNRSTSYTINIRLRNDEDNQNFIFKIRVEGFDNEGFDNEGFDNEGFDNEDKEKYNMDITGGYKKRRRITKKRKITKRKKNSKRRRFSKKRN